MALPVHHGQIRRRRARRHLSAFRHLHRNFRNACRACDRTQGPARLRRLVQETRRRRVAARRMARLFLRIRHTFLLLRNNGMDRRLYVQISRRPYGAGGGVWRRCRRLRRVRLRPRADDTLPSGCHGGGRRGGLPRDKRRHREELQGAHAGALRHHPDSHRPLRHSSGRGGRAALLFAARLLQGERGRYSRRRRPGLLLALARNGDHDNLRKLPRLA